MKDEQRKRILREMMTGEESRGFPPMPDDFWPESLIITGRHLGKELSAVATAADVQNRLHAVRLALWQATHWNLK